MSERTINISVTAQPIIGCAIELILGGQRYSQHRMCSSENVQTPVVIHFETTKLPCE